jgi:hypothetical protein
MPVDQAETLNTPSEPSPDQFTYLFQQLMFHVRETLE